MLFGSLQSITQLTRNRLRKTEEAEKLDFSVQAKTLLFHCVEMIITFIVRAHLKGWAESL